MICLLLSYSPGLSWFISQCLIALVLFLLSASVEFFQLGGFLGVNIGFDVNRG